MKERKRPCLARRIIGDILLALTILLAADVVIVMIHKINLVVLKQTYQKIFVYEILLLVVLLIFVLDVRFGIFSWFKNKATRIIGWIFRVIFALGSAIILFFCGKVLVNSVINTSGPAQYAIVLGMALENGKPTKDLLFRVETGRKYLEEYPDAILILTGGNADESGKTEADVMHDLLVQDGVAEDSMYLEDKAQTTVENFMNTAQMVDPAEPIVLISSDYHMGRALKEAKKAGFEQVLRLPAKSEFLTFGSSMMWEVIMEIRN